jgi:acetolactate synthase I/II/III large subunit
LRNLGHNKDNERNTFRARVHRTDGTDFAALARAVGCQGITARSIADLEFLRAWLEHRDGPMVVDAKVDPDICADWLEEAFRAH